MWYALRCVEHHLNLKIGHVLQGKLHEAAAMYARASAHDKAVTMFRDLRMFR